MPVFVIEVLASSVASGIIDNSDLIEGCFSNIGKKIKIDSEW